MLCLLIVSALSFGGLCAVTRLGPVTAAPGEALGAVEAEFRAAIQRATQATVVVVPRDLRGATAGFSSGVIVSAAGYVLSDGDAGMVIRRRDGKDARTRSDDVLVRVPNALTGAFRTYRARVVARDTQVDTSLIRILNPPAKGLPFVPPGHSDSLRVGQFALAVGSQTFEDGGTQPALTAGLVAALEPAPAGSTIGKYSLIYVSAAVNEGVNGGPVVDLDGRLVATISTYLRPTPEEPFQFLGKAVPMDRIRATLSGVAAAQSLFQAASPAREPNTPAHALETVFEAAGQRAYPVAVSLEVQRKSPVSRSAPLGDKTVEIPRYEGPVSGILISSDGFVATHLYNLTNVASLVEPFWKVSAGAEFLAGIEAIEGATVSFPEGGSAAAVLVGVDRRYGVALWKLDPKELAAAGGPSTLSGPALAPADAFHRGRFVLALGNPFGSDPHPMPLLTLGILSKFHADTAVAPWRGHWQTDAAGLDSNAGGPVVDIEGRLMGMLALWHPAKHGRNSGVAFVLPQEQLLASVAFIRSGATREAGFLGVEFKPGLKPVIRTVVDDSAASQAGVEAGDAIEEIDGHPTATVLDAVLVIRQRTAGETVRVRFRRGEDERKIEIILGARPSD